MPAGASVEVPTGAASSMGRSESMAYPRTNSSLSRLQWYLRHNSKAVLATLTFIVFLLFISSDVLHDSEFGPSSSLRKTGGFFRSSSSSPLAGAVRGGYFRVSDSVDGNTFKFAAVTDLDQLSKVESKKPTFRSILLPGTITRNPSTNKYKVKFQDSRELVTKHNEAGRGAEFSELQIFNDRLMTFDDRTGDVFEILNKPDGKESFVVPRFVLTEGDGDTDKGMKWEWATVKNGELYMGSMGKEYTNPDGSIANTNNLWVTVLSPNSEIRRIDWSRQFTFVREQLGASSPGYVIHEAINWSPYLNKWVFLPRRVSKDAYDDVLDEKRGSNKVVLVNDAFTSAEVVTVNMASKDGLHGFSSFAFVPGTNDRHVLALRSVEEDCAGDDLNVCKQRSYILVFDVLTGEVLMDEVQLPQLMKFEGVEFVDIFKKPPKH